MSSKKTIYSIQFLRGFAALAVVLHHTGGYLKIYHSPSVMFGDYFNIGFAGVDLFFVMSGFIIHFTCKNYINNPVKLKEYCKKRFAKVYPIYWFITTVMFVIAWIVTRILHKNIFTIDYPIDFWAIIKMYTLYPLHFAINPVTWTLSHEMFFYLSFALLIISKRLWIIPTVFLSLSFYYRFIDIPANLGATMNYHVFFFSGYNLEFIFGFFSLKFYEKIVMPNWLSITLLLLSLGIVISFGQIAGDYDSAKRVVIFGLPSGIILVSLLNLERQRVITKFPQFFITLGDASYSLYLIHFPMMLLMFKLPQILNFSVAINQWEFYGYFIIVSIVFVSIFIHKWIEKPLNSLILK